MLAWSLLLTLSSGDALAGQRTPVALVVSDTLEAYEGPVGPFMDQVGRPTTVHQIRGREDRAAAVVAELKRNRPEVAFCIGAKAAYAVRQGMPNLPLVYALVQDPARYGIEGTQVTGVTMRVEPVTYLSQFLSFFPDVQKVGVIRRSGAGGSQGAAITEAAEALELELEVAEVSGPRDLRGAVARLADADIDALWVPPDREVLTNAGFRSVAEEARRRGLPLLTDTANMVEAGGLFSVVPDPDSVGKQAAVLVQKIVDGAAPSVLEPQDPENLLVVLNVRTLRTAGIPFDDLLLDFVDIKLE